MESISSPSERDAYAELLRFLPLMGLTANSAPAVVGPSAVDGVRDCGVSFGDWQEVRLPGVTDGGGRGEMATSWALFGLMGSSTSMSATVS